MKNQEIIFANVGIGMIIILGLMKVILKNGIFCYSPCGPHVCILDTNKGTEHLQSTLERVAEDYHSREIKKTLPRSTDSLHCAELVKKCIDNNSLETSTIYKCNSPRIPPIDLCKMEAGLASGATEAPTSESFGKKESPTKLIEKNLLIEWRKIQSARQERQERQERQREEEKKEEGDDLCTIS